MGHRTDEPNDAKPGDVPTYPHTQCRINHGANGAAAPGPPHRAAPPHTHTHQVLKNRFIWLTHCTYCSESNLEIMIS